MCSMLGRYSGRRYRTSLAFAVCALAAALSVAGAQEDQDCQVCHGDPSMVATLPDGTTRSMYVDASVYSHSAHGENGCVSCHADISELPHAPELAPVDCGACHAEPEEYAKSVHGQALQRGETDVASCRDCHGAHEIRKTDDPLSMVHPRNLPATCGKCHSDPALAKRHMFSVRHPSETYLQSVHGRAQTNETNGRAATCSKCHGSHDIQPSQDPRSPVFHMNVPATCGQCHPEVVEEYKSSIHGKALEAGVASAPNCTDCHGEHDIVQAEGPESEESARQNMQAMCMRCHGDENVMERFGVPTKRQASYMDSYHGLTSASGANVVAMCTDCHGVHSILPAANAASTIHPANLPATCAKCHPDAGPNFAAGVVHIVPTDPGQRIYGIVRIVYLWIIFGLLGFMTLHNMLLWIRHSIHKLAVQRVHPKRHRRFSTAHLLGHGVLAISFVVLAISGFALRYPESLFTRVLFLGDAGFHLRGDVHRIAAVASTIITVVVILYLVFSRKGRQEAVSLMFCFKDARDLFHTLGYALGLASAPPKLGWFSYREKLEYWGLLWGSVLMTLTGYCMWFANAFLSYWPKVALDIAALIHFYEAILAVGTILVWHMYFVILDPETYPMNWTWLTGRITDDEFKTHHALEYERQFESAGTIDDSREAGDNQSNSR